MSKANSEAGGFKTSVGGQALIEGIMMRGPEKMCLAVRQPDGTIYTSETVLKKHPWQKWPFIRGVFALIDSMVNGYKCLMKSAEISMTEEEAEEEKSRLDKWIDRHFGEKGTEFVMALSSVLGVVLALGLFLVLPTAIVNLLNRFVPLGMFKALLEGLIKIALLVGYMAAVSRVKEIARVFRYHGAEHKTIACYEAGKELTVENIRPCCRFHPRCGTSFILIVLIISILVMSLVPWHGTGMRVLLKLLFLPVIVGISYEIIKICGRYDNIVTRIVSAPGLWLQRITTSEPDDGMIECAIAAVTPVLPENREDGRW